MDNSKETEILNTLKNENHSEFSHQPTFHKHKRSTSEISAWEELSDDFPLRSPEPSSPKSKIQPSSTLQKSLQGAKKLIPISPTNKTKKYFNDSHASEKFPDIKSGKKPFYRFTTEEAKLANPISINRKPSWLSELKVIRINEFRPICSNNIGKLLKITAYLKKDNFRSLSQTKKKYYLANP